MVVVLVFCFRLQSVAEKTKIQNDQNEADKNILKIKWEEAVRDASQAKHQCALLEQSARELQQQNTQYRQEEAMLKTAMETKYEYAINEKKNEIDQINRMKKKYQGTGRVPLLPCFLLICAYRVVFFPLCSQMN